MGVEAVAKQAAAHIFLSGAGGLAIEIAKNLVLSGCKSFTMHDTKPITKEDMSGQFFLNITDKTKTRVEACLPRLQQLNFYVRCKIAPLEPIPLKEEDLEKDPWNF
jgi:molybdopterin/thiamine biosynthesis adenylyltransferase